MDSLTSKYKNDITIQLVQEDGSKKGVKKVFFEVSGIYETQLEDITADLKTYTSAIKFEHASIEEEIDQDTASKMILSIIKNPEFKDELKNKLLIADFSDDS